MSRPPIRIERITITHHRLALDPPFHASWDGRPRRHFDVTVVRVADSEGRVGIGSGDLMQGFDAHEDLFIGQDPRALSRHAEVLEHVAFHHGRCWPLDLALWDLAGQIAGAPVWRLLGGASGRVPLYASAGVLRAPEALADLAERVLAEGFAAMKIRFSSAGAGRGSWRDDIVALETVCARVGDRLTLMVDCNQGWRMPWDTTAPWAFKDALAVAQALEPLGVFWMEEPLHRADRAGMRALRAATPVRIAGGEMTREREALRDLVEERCLDILQPDCALTGGITGLAEIARSALRAGLGFTPHSWTNGIGVLANAHLCAGVGGGPWLEYPYDPPDWSEERRDFALARPLARTGGMLELGEDPGLGVVLDEDRLQATRLS